jgi:hypothetical protein
VFLKPINFQPGGPLDIFSGGELRELMQKMKTPCGLADGIKGRKVNGVLRATFFLSRSEARRRAKQLFGEFPSGAYMTEIEAWRELPGGVIELTIKRLKDAIDEPE